MDSRNHEPQDPLDPLLAQLAELRKETAKLDAPRGVEKELLQAFARQFPPKKRWYQKLAPGRALQRWAVAGGLSTAVTAMTVFGLLLHNPRLGADPDARSRGLVSRDGGGLFIALESPERIEQEPAPRMVETEVSRSSLAPLGVPLTPENAGDTVRAEMLLGADGQPLAVRLTSIE
jgi:hypothetical protein